MKKPEKTADALLDEMLFGNEKPVAEPVKVMDLKFSRLSRGKPSVFASLRRKMTSKVTFDL